jgi:hypothetical protein
MSFVLEFSSFFLLFFFKFNGICSITLSEIFASLCKKKSKASPQKKKKRKKNCGLKDVFMNQI